MYAPDIDIDYQRAPTHFVLDTITSRIIFRAVA